MKSKRPSSLDELFIDKFILSRIKRNKNCLIFIAGDHGSGKSYSALTVAKNICAMQGKEFKIDNVVFTVQDFFELSLKLKNGGVIIFDEVGANLPPEKWYETINLLFDKWLQVFRYKRQIVIFTAFDRGDVMKRIRKRFHHFVYIIDNDGRRAWGNWYEIKKFYRVGSGVLIQERFPRVQENGTTYVLNPVYIRKPPRKLWKKYEERREEEVGRKHEEKILAEISELAAEVERTELTDKEIVNIILENPERFKTKRGKINHEAIQVEFGVGLNRARKIKLMAERALGIE